MREFGGRLRRDLLQAGLVRRGVEPGQRPVTIETWEGAIEEISNACDVSKVQVVRCLLELFAASEGLQPPPPPVPALAEAGAD